MTPIAALVAAAVFAVAPPLKVTLTGQNHAPTINTHWTYTVGATRAGTAVHGTLTMQIVDPIGGVHPLGVGKGKGYVTNRAFDGRYSDFVVWPATSRGVPLTLRATVKVGGTKRVATFLVTPRAAVAR